MAQLGLNSNITMKNLTGERKAVLSQLTITNCIMADAGSVINCSGVIDAARANISYLDCEELQIAYLYSSDLEAYSASVTSASITNACVSSMSCVRTYTCS